MQHAGQPNPEPNPVDTDCVRRSLIGNERSNVSEPTPKFKESLGGCERCELGDEWKRRSRCGNKLGPTGDRGELTHGPGNAHESNGEE